MKKRFLMASLVATIAVSSSADATQYVVNGNFSQLTHGLGELNYNTVATGWSTKGYNFVFHKADQGVKGQFGKPQLWDKANGGATTWNGLSPTGDNYVAMDGGYHTAPVMQTITGLTIGDTYNLSFIYAFSQQYKYNGPTIQNISTSFGGHTVFTSANYNLPGHSFSGWMSYTGKLTATSTSEVLSFLAYGNKPVPPFALFTDVSLTNAVPEPATWAMMIVGLGCIGAVARRRQRSLAAA